MRIEYFVLILKGKLVGLKDSTIENLSTFYEI